VTGARRGRAITSPTWIAPAGRSTTTVTERAPHHRPHPGDELADAVRLGDVVVGSDLEPDDGVDLAALRGHHDDRHLAAQRSWRHTSMPLIFGSITSSSTTSGRHDRTLERLDPVVATSTSNPSREADLQRLDEALLVLDDEHGGSAHATPRMVDATP
jgi:hypothetical protein